MNTGISFFFLAPALGFGRWFGACAHVSKNRRFEMIWGRGEDGTGYLVDGGGGFSCSMEMAA